MKTAPNHVVVGFNPSSLLKDKITMKFSTSLAIPTTFRVFRSIEGNCQPLRYLLKHVD